MALTPRRWRRRIRVTSSLEACCPLIPRDLSIRLPQVQRDDVEEPVVLFAEEPGYRELDQRACARVRRERPTDLNPMAQLLEFMAVEHRTVADRQHLPLDG